MKRWLWVLASGALLAAGLVVVDPSSVMDELSGLRPITLVAALVLTAGSTLLMALRWVVLVDDARSARTQMMTYLRATFLNALTPGNVGGDAYRFVVVQRLGRGKGEVVGLLAHERVLGAVAYFGGFVLAGSAMALTGDVPRAFANGMSAAVAAIVVGALGTWMLSRHGRWQWFGTTTAMLRLRDRRSRLLVGLSFASWAAWMASVALVASDVGVDASLLVVVAAAGLTEIVRFVPITFQGIGVREAAFAFFVASAGGDRAAGFAAGAAAYAVLTVVLLAAGPASAVMRRTGPEETMSRSGDTETG